ncbi:MAG TPA: ABC transporter substrate-binding protein [Vicinamibacteria bacterium]|nr:ABC transporter substrate-binding protein [Vicinamibacteria bacterium]
MLRQSRTATLVFVLIGAHAALVTASEQKKRGKTHQETRTTDTAVLLDLEGAQASIGRPAMNGFLLGLQEATGNGLLPFVALLDTKSDPETTREAAQSAASSVSMAAGFTDNDSVSIAGPHFQRERVPFLSVGATDPSLPEVVGEYVFLTPFGDNTQAAAGAEFARREFGASVAILWDSTSQYTRTLPRYFRTRFEELGGNVLLDVSYAGCDLSVQAGLVSGLPMAPDFVYLAGLPDCIGDVVASLRGSGVMQPILGGDGLDTPELLEGGSGPLPTPTSSVWLTTHAWLSEETGTPEAKAFIAAYRDAYGVPPPDAFAALGYDAARLTVDVLRRARPQNRNGIFRALERTDEFEGVTGTISFSSESHVPLKTVWILKVQNAEMSLADAFIPDSVPPPLGAN